MNVEARRSATQFNISSDAIILFLSGAAFLLHLYAARNYGYFTDELYYLACSHHLAWGYVDQPPLIALVTWITLQLLGESLVALRSIPAMASAAEIALTGLIARELGGGRFAQMLACLAALFAPGILISDGLLTMNAFEPLFWLGCAYLFIRIVRENTAAGQSSVGSG